MKKLIFPKNNPQRMLPQSSKGYFAALEHLCHNMAESERRQSVLVAGGDPSVDEYDPSIAFRTLSSYEGIAFFYLGDDSMPVAAGGYRHDGAVGGVWQSWMIGTDDGWKRYWRDLTKGSLWLMAQLFDGGARRLETTVIASRTDAQKWYTDFLGLTLEGERRGYLPNGESIMLFGMTEEDFHVRRR